MDPQPPQRMPQDPAAESGAAEDSVKPVRGSSTYSTGGGGVSFAHRVATVYLACGLTSTRRPEAFELPVRRVLFQTGPAHPVDDLLVKCGDGTSEVTLAVACRATPNFIPSDEETMKLLGSLLAEIEKFDSEFHRVVVATAGLSKQSKDLAMACAVARDNADPESFRAAMEVDRRWSKDVRGRYEQALKMVEKAVAGEAAAEEVLRLTWRLLSRLRVIGFAVQSPDESDRTAVATSLDAVASTQANGVLIRDRIEVVATRYDAVGAVVDLKLLRRDLHELLDSSATWSRRVRSAIAEHRKLAAANVRTTIGGLVGGSVEVPFSDRRAQLSRALRDAAASGAALLVCGESGTGKSALVHSAVAELEAADPAGFEAVVVNFRGLPQTSMQFRAEFGMSMEELLAHLSAPKRVLVVDAADAALERSSPLLTYLVKAAADAGVGVVAVSSDVAAGSVREHLEFGSGKLVSSFTMETLGDGDIALVSTAFPLLRPVLRDLPAKSLFRRLVVLDLLARTGAQPESSMGEWECLLLVWSKVVRAEGRAGAGSAEAREQTLLAVAASKMRLPEGQRPHTGIDAAAVDALRQDHLLAPSNPYQGSPEFAHDEVRLYATAILLVKHQAPTQLLEAVGAPRWALSAATLACKGLLKKPGAQPVRVFAKLHSQFQSFAAERGPRWADVPLEAVLETSSSAYDCLKATLQDQAAPLGLGDVVRVVQQRHKVDALIDPVVAAPVVRFLLDDEKPWAVSNESFELLADWLHTLSVRNEPEGNELRVRLRTRLLAYWRSFPRRAVSDSYLARSMSARRWLRRELDYHLTNDEFVETLALLGPDIDDDAEACLLAIAADAPAFLAPAADNPLSARAVAQKDPKLLATLIEAF